MTSSFSCIYDVLLLLRPLVLDLLYFMSSDESDSINDDYEDDGYDSRSSGICAFPSSFEYSIGWVSGVGSGVFVTMVVDSKCDVVTFVVFFPIGGYSKDSRLVEMVWRSNSCFFLQNLKSVL